MRIKTWLVNGLIVCVTIGVAVLVAEVVLRLVAPQPVGLSHQDRYGLAMHWPGVVRRLPNHGTTASFNSVGMRDREHAVEKAPGVYRVLVLGDSFMEALQVEFEESFPNLLERELGRATGKSVEVINAGVSGWGTDDELRYLTEYGVRWKPDLVLVAMTLHNDISDNLRETWHTAKAGPLVDQPVEPMSVVQFKIVELKAFVATTSQLYQLWRKVRRGREMKQIGHDLNMHIVDLFREPPTAQIAYGYRLTDLLLQRIDSVTRAGGGRTALVLLPLRVQGSDSAFTDFVRQAGVPPANMPPDQPQRIMDAAAKRLGLTVVDLLPAFRQWPGDASRGLYVEGDGHWNKAGHRVAADAVVRALDTAGVVR